MIVYGLTGGIACGKSAVTRILREQEGIPVIDCDEIAHAVYLPGTWGYSRVMAAFSEGPPLLPNGCVDREALGKIVFHDRSQRKLLEKAVGPPILIEILRQLLYHWAAGESLVVIDAPTLYETKHLLWICSRVIVVSTDAKTQLQRVITRDGLSRADAERRIAAQMPLRKKCELADVVLDNSKTLDALRTVVATESRRAKLDAKQRFGFPSPLMLLIGFVVVSPAAYCAILSRGWAEEQSRL